MKKNYFAPEMKVVKINARRKLLTSSLQVEGFTNNAREAEAREFEFDEEDW